jgi:cobaltochelatase CobT
MTDRESRIEEFKRVTGAAMRAIAERDDLTVSFAPGQHGLFGTEARLPPPAHELPANEVANVRGEADSIALKLRHHNAMLHAREAPTGEMARAVFDAVEQARVEAIGARQMVGVSENLSAALSEHCRQRGFARVTERGDGPLSEVIRMLVREALTGAAPPREAKRMVDLWRPNMSDQVRSDLTHLADVIADQRAYAKAARQLLADLDMDLGAENADSADENADSDDPNKQDDTNESRGEGGDQDSQESYAQMDAQKGDPGEDDNETTTAEASADMMAEGGEEDPGRPGRPPQFDDKRGRNEPTYKAFTTQFDETIDATELCDPDELTRLRQLLDQQLSHLQAVVAKLANRLQRRLMAQQSRAWEFDLEEGLLDTARLARVVVNPATPLSFKREKEMEFRDTVVTLLIDNSGSMRGRPITVAAMSADILARTLERCGGQSGSARLHHAHVEGRAIARALDRGGQAGQPRPPQRPPPYHLQVRRRAVAAGAQEPGPDAARGHPQGEHRRRGAAVGPQPAGRARRAAQDPDGDLRRRPGRRFHPLGQSRQLPGAAPARGDRLDRERLAVELIAIGIGHDVTRYYRRAVTIVDAEQLGGTMLEKLAELFEEKAQVERPTPRRAGGRR